VLRPNGIFLAKIFKGNDVKFLYSQFKVFFNSVYIIKPRSSRTSSVEAFIVCLEYSPPKDYIPKRLSTFDMDLFKTSEGKKEEFNSAEKKVFDFVTCGDLSGFDEM
jgi:tRNA (cytidine32/guanosine34-2'-O)-methyltransferase